VIIYDDDKNQRNIKERGLPFDKMNDFDWDNALVALDDRYDYDEDRYRALGFIDKLIIVSLLLCLHCTVMISA
jgi:uncharacterized protein